jgi:hypothetical protein
MHAIIYTFYADPQAASHQPITYPQQGAPQGTPAIPQQSGSSLYPSLGDYMGLNLTPEFVEQNMPVVWIP